MDSGKAGEPVVCQDKNVAATEQQDIAERISQRRMLEEELNRKAVESARSESYTERVRSDFRFTLSEGEREEVDFLRSEAREILTGSR